MGFLSEYLGGGLINQSIQASFSCKYSSMRDSAFNQSPVLVVFSNRKRVRVNSISPHSLHDA